MRRTLTSLSFVAFLGLGGLAMAQVTGVVNDANNFPEMDAEVVVKGTDKVAYTDENGKFDIDAKIGDVLVINGKEFTVTSNNLGVVKYAEEDVALQEVIVTAYGTQTKESLTGSVGEVKAKDIANVTSTNVVQGMTGKVAGVQVISNNGMPGSEPTVRFRGIGSITGSAAPLYVVDGVPFNGNVSAINNQDIESISFLKDASAAALYGNRGANGVIIITTKKGVKGGDRYTLDLKSGIASRGVKEYAIKRSPSQHYTDHFAMLYETQRNAGASHDVAMNWANTNLISNSTYGLRRNVTNVANNAIIDPTTGKFSNNASILYSENWEDYLFKDGFFTQTHFSGSGATDKTSYFYSAGYDKNDGYVVNSGIEKFTGRIKIDNKISDRLSVGANVAYTNMTRKTVDGFEGSSAFSNPFSWTRAIAPIYPVHAYRNGQIVLDANGNPRYDDGTATYTGAPRPYGSLQNPYATAVNDIKKTVYDQVFANGYAKVNLLDGLDFTYSVTAELNQSLNKNVDTPLYGDAVNAGGRVQNQSSRVFALTQQQLLTYKKRLGDHNIDVLLGHETLDRKSEGLLAYRTNMLLPNSPYVNHASLLTDAQSWGTPYATEGFFARFNYDFANKYYLNANIRRDGSSRFHPDNRWGNFYGVGAAWRISQENFLKDSSVINELKLKASYGEQGNDDLGYDFPYLDLYTLNMEVNPNFPLGYVQTFKGNRDITWETNANFNAGFDLGMFNNRLTIEAEYFLRKSQDMLFMKPLNLSEGFASYPENIGDMKNEGVEVTLGVGVVRNEDFQFNINANGTYLKNKITALPDETIVSGSYIFEVGNSRYDWYLREYAGVNKETGAAQFYVVDATTGEKTITETYAQATLQRVGKSAVPKFYGGFGFDMAYKGFDLNVAFAYQAGGWGYDSEYMALFDGGIGQTFHEDYKNTWSQSNKDANLPTVLALNSKNYYSTSTMGLIKSDYISLQNISVGYTFNKDLVAPIGIKSLRIYALADNVAVWSKRQGYDPRLSYTGVSSNQYSPLRTISGGININF